MDRIEVVKLNGTNYCSWKRKVEFLLIRDDLWRYVVGTKPVPWRAAVGSGSNGAAGADQVVLNAAEIEAWDNGDQRARATIGLLMEDTQSLIKNATTAKLCWNALKDHFETSKVALLKRLCGMQYSELLRRSASEAAPCSTSLAFVCVALSGARAVAWQESEVENKLKQAGARAQLGTRIRSSCEKTPKLEDIQQHVQQMEVIFERLAMAGQELDEDLCVAMILRSCQARSDEELTLKQVDEVAKSGTRGAGESVLKVDHQKRKKVLICYFCKKPGPKEKFCRAKNAVKVDEKTREMLEQPKLVKFLKMGMLLPKKRLQASSAKAASAKIEFGAANSAGNVDRGMKTPAKVAPVPAPVAGPSVSEMSMDQIKAKLSRSADLAEDFAEQAAEWVRQAQDDKDKMENVRLETRKSRFRRARGRRHAEAPGHVDEPHQAALESYPGDDQPDQGPGLPAVPNAGGFGPSGAAAVVQVPLSGRAVQVN
ncbi:uncharacterized protein LOC120428179 [Culex pipiens pallens]|uniref:uncharacterized protein LOC120428179 n=1 Tax=Culex pipiens pallens TaxID=42434 RepID=UPI0019548809|nr:uncharacterized protein LOC120428179 [Culex pipiens pallens]